MPGRVLAAMLFAAAGIAQTGAPAPRDLIDGIKTYEGTLGMSKTGNFEHDADTVKSYYRCYYTGALELPESYDDLKLRQGTDTGCGMDPRQYDVFFYAMQAAGSGKTPVTKSLAHSPPERILVVVPHEDYHARKDLPTAVSEAAATLVGFAVGADFARQQFGESSSVYRNLIAEPDLFLRKAGIVNRYYAVLRGVYDRLHAGGITSPEAFAEKGRLFEQMRGECNAIAPNPHSFNKSLSAYNNAGLAFDRTYTKFYPLVYELFEAESRDLKATIDALGRALSAHGLTEDQAAANIQATIEARRRE